MMLGFLLARAGVTVTVLEKHADFLRDFRGDTIHPSTLELMHELGLLDEFLKLPHRRVIASDRPDRRRPSHAWPTSRICRRAAISRLDAAVGFSRLPRRARQALCRLRPADAHGGDRPDRGGRPRRRRARHDARRRLEIRADLVVGADGRHSTVRARAGLHVEDLGAPMDVLWFRMSRRTATRPKTFGHVEAGRMLVMLNRGDYWQCAYVIPKGGYDNGEGDGPRRLPRQRRRDLAVPARPHRRDRGLGRRQAADGRGRPAAAVAPPGLLCIGDAAHAMSPIGGVGINLAIQDAVAAANMLAAPLQRRHGHARKRCSHPAAARISGARDAEASGA